MEHKSFDIDDIIIIMSLYDIIIIPEQSMQQQWHMGDFQAACMLQGPGGALVSKTS